MIRDGRAWALNPPRHATITPDEVGRLANLAGVVDIDDAPTHALRLKQPPTIHLEYALQSVQLTYRMTGRAEDGSWELDRVD
jgi:hypothetical protein